MLPKNENKINLIKDKHDNFTVYKSENCHTFISIYIDEKHEEKFFKDIFGYFFSDEKLLMYVNNKTSINFTPTKTNYCTLYKNLSLYFIDEENAEVNINDFNEITKEVLLDEEELLEKDGKLYVRKDKIGKIGEYIFSSLLRDYFKFDCIIPKLLLTTDPNMNVYGIDALFYSEKDDLLMFGEAKVSKNLNNGIKLISESLKDYDRQIQQEYKCVLSNSILSKLLSKFPERFGDIVAVCISIEDFIEKTEIKTIGIPLFIAHGEDTNPNEIIETLKNISVGKVLGIATRLVVISLPIVDKKKFTVYFTKFIKEKLELYNENM